MCDRGAALFSYGPKTETMVKTIQQLCLIARSMVSLVNEQPCLNTSNYCALHVGDSRPCAIVSYSHKSCDSHKSSKGHEWDFPAGLCSSPINPLTFDFSNLP